MLCMIQSKLCFTTYQVSLRLFWFCIRLFHCIMNCFVRNKFINQFVIDVCDLLLDMFLLNYSQLNIEITIWKAEYNIIVIVIK